MKTNTIEIEFDTQQNANIYFQPMQRILRGRFDVRRMKDGGRLYNSWPEPIPGQRLQLDIGTGEAAIIEPLWDAQFSAIREKIESKGMKIGPGRESVKADVPTWCYWLRQLIETGKAKLLSGTLPTKIDGTPQTRFHSTEQPDASVVATDKLTHAIQQQTAAIEKLLAKIVDK